MSGLRFRPSIGFRGNFGEISGDFGGFWEKQKNTIKINTLKRDRIRFLKVRILNFIYIKQ
ncbi:hypothetical protein DVQ06_21005 [Yersinia enterocolitica]|nr:hypothetical protein [Yersinia enterocolitica]